MPRSETLVGCPGWARPGQSRFGQICLTCSITQTWEILKSRALDSEHSAKPFTGSALPHLGAYPLFRWTKFREELNSNCESTFSGYPVRGYCQQSSENVVF